MTDTQFVPLAVLALELHQPIDNLARRLAGDVVVDPVTGLRAVPATFCRTYLAKVHDEARRIHQDALRMQAERAANDPALLQRARVRAIQAAQAVPPPDGVSAFEVMLANDPENALNRAGRHMDEMLRGGGTYHPINRKD